MPRPWLSGEPGRWRIRLHVQPGASRTRIVGEYDDCLKVAVEAPPVDGRANDALLRWFAKRLGVPRSALQIAQGAGGRRKQLSIDAPLPARSLESLLD